MPEPGSIHMVVLTGAGISAGSGIRTFRDNDGLWEGLDPMQVATPEAWRADRQLVWRFYQQRRAQLGEVEPNVAHHALAELERALTEAGQVFTLVSQNVDDLHQRAGSRVLEMHGQLLRLCCEGCTRVVEDRKNFEPDRFVPCPSCGRDLRPDVVWFGEMPQHFDEIAEAMEDATHFFACGTSGAVYPAANLLSVAREGGIPTFVNSLDAPDNLDPRDVFWPGEAVEVVPRQVAAWRAEWGV